MTPEDLEDLIAERRAAVERCHARAESHNNPSMAKFWRDAAQANAREVDYLMGLLPARAVSAAFRVFKLRNE